MPAWLALILEIAGGVVAVGGAVGITGKSLRWVLGIIKDIQDAVAGVRDVAATFSWYVALCEPRFEAIEHQLGLRERRSEQQTDRRRNG